MYLILFYHVSSLGTLELWDFWDGLTLQELDLVLRKSLKAKREGMKASGMYRQLRGASCHVSFQMKGRNTVLIILIVSNSCY